MKLITLGALVFAGWCAISAHAQMADPKNEIPIERCDRLPVVTVKIGAENKRFLLDTGATTILNIKSFASGESKQIRVESWSGSAATSAREVSLNDVQLGSHKLANLKLPAIDLSPIGKACGGQIDGILGVDLLDRMGVTIDLKRRQVAVPDAPSIDSSASFADMESDMSACNTAFNQGNAKATENCFDPEIILYTPHGEFHGRKEVMRYLTERYFKFAPKLRYEMSPHDIRSYGDALWYTYDFSIETPAEHVSGHGMAMCHKNADGHWRVLNMHNSLRDPSPAADPVD